MECVSNKLGDVSRQEEASVAELHRIFPTCEDEGFEYDNSYGVDWVDGVQVLSFDRPIVTVAVDKAAV